MSDPVIDILVPVLGRPQNVKPFLESVAITSYPYRVFFICTISDKEQIAACEASGTRTLIHPHPAGKADFAKKINWAFPQTDAPWVFQAADDLRFHEGWDTYAIRMGDTREVGVVGTDDMGNALVMRGGHSTHTLIRRAYITSYGGTYDNSGLVFSELYDHQYCDNEFVQTAIRRGQWAFSKRSKVEHLHPAWGKGPMDATYDKALRATSRDARLYKDRMQTGMRMESKRRRTELMVKRRGELLAKRREANELRNRRKRV
jgi:hypothetical protein